MHLTIIIRRLMMGQRRVGEAVNYFILTRLTMLAIHAPSNWIGTFSPYICFSKVFSPKAEWYIISAVIAPFTGVATTLAKI